jgi:predicted negative regulator of RcsB-dependent stress response
MRERAALGLAGMLAEEGKNQEALPWLNLASKSEDNGVSSKANLALGDLATALGSAQLARKYYERVIASRSQPAADIAQSRLKATG